MTRCITSPTSSRERSVMAMNWEHWRDENSQGWESRVPVHVGPKGYDRQSFIEDPEHVSGVIAFDRPRLNGGRGLAGGG